MRHLLCLLLLLVVVALDTPGNQHTATKDARGKTSNSHAVASHSEKISGRLLDETVDEDTSCVAAGSAKNASLSRGILNRVSDHKSIVDSHGSGSHGSGGHHGSHPHDALCFLFFSIVVGILTTWIISRYAHTVPFTVSLFLEGVLLGLIHSWTNGQLGRLSVSLDMWLAIDPHLLLYAFLPALLFGDSMALSWHEFRRCAGQCMILAGPGVLIGCTLTALFQYYVLDLGWSMHLCLAFGSILSATDPVAVVALLKEMGVDKTLTMQIMGESLLNDGVAIVIWTMFFKMSKGYEYTVGEIIGFFLQLAAGGVVFGQCLGVATLYWIAKASDKMQHHDHLIQLTLTIACAYLAFFVGENECHVSGVLAVIFAALCLAKQAWPVFCSREGVEHVWHAIEFIGNTLIFILAGAIFGELLLSHATAENWLTLFAVWAAMMLFRGIMLVILYPFLSRMGHGMSLRELVVVWWGGLRGAVGLALALAMQKDEEVDKHTGDQILWLVGGAAALTMFINAPTCGPLINFLQLSTPPEARRRLITKLRFANAKQACQVCEQLKKLPMFTEQWVNKRALQQYVKALRLREEILENMLCTWSIGRDKTVLVPQELVGVVFEGWKHHTQQEREKNHPGQNAFKHHGGKSNENLDEVKTLKQKGKSSHNLSKSSKNSYNLANLFGGRETSAEHAIKKVKERKSVLGKVPDEPLTRHSCESQVPELPDTNRRTTQRKTQRQTGGSIAGRSSAHGSLFSLSAQQCENLLGGEGKSELPEVGRRSMAKRASELQHGNKRVSEFLGAGGAKLETGIKDVAPIKEDVMNQAKDINFRKISSQHKASLSQGIPQQRKSVPGWANPESQAFANTMLGELLPAVIKQEAVERKTMPETMPRAPPMEQKSPVPAPPPLQVESLPGAIVDIEEDGATKTVLPISGNGSNACTAPEPESDSNQLKSSHTRNVPSKQSIKPMNSEPLPPKQDSKIGFTDVAPDPPNPKGDPGFQRKGKRTQSSPAGDKKMQEKTNLVRGTIKQGKTEEKFEEDGDVGRRMQQDMMNASGMKNILQKIEDTAAINQNMPRATKMVNSSESSAIQISRLGESVATTGGASDVERQGTTTTFGADVQERMNSAVCSLNSTDFDVQNTLETFLAQSGQMQSDGNHQHCATVVLADELDQGELKVERELFLNMLRSEYWAQMSCSRLPENSMAASRLLESVDIALDCVRYRLTDWNAIYRKIILDSRLKEGNANIFKTAFFRGYRRLADAAAAGVGFKQYMPCYANGISFDVFTCVCFVDAHLATQEKLADGGVLGRLTNSRIHVLMESLAEVGQVWKFLDAHVSTEAIVTVRTKQLALSVLTAQRDIILGWIENGMLSGKEAHELLEIVHHDLHALVEDHPIEGLDQDEDDDSDWDEDEPQSPEAAGARSPAPGADGSQNGDGPQESPDVAAGGSTDHSV